MTEKIDLKKLYYESKKEGTEKQTKMERALEGVVYGFPGNIIDNPVLEITTSQENTDG